MTYYKVVNNGFVQFVGKTNKAAENEITEEEYNTIIAVINDKPSATETTDYRLREDLTWEEYEVEPPDPDPDIDDAELLTILMGGAE